MEGRIDSEWGRLRKVVVHRPGMEMFLGLLDPTASLYERSFNQEAAQKEHDAMVHALKDEFNVRVETLEDSIKTRAGSNRKAKSTVIDAALKSISFSGDRKEVSTAIKNLKENVDEYDLDYFLNAIILMPKVSVRRARGADAMHVSVTEKDPLANLYFMRDQQAVTDKGIFMSRMSKPQRRREPFLTKILWGLLGLPIVHEASAPGTFEGGDFMPMGNFAMIGLGDRTNKSGAEQMLEYGQSFQEVAVVHQPSHPLIHGNKPDPMIDMHLDTYCNVAGNDTIIGSELLLKRAIVEVYKKGGGAYNKETAKTNLHDYLRSKGFNVINLSTIEQMSYSSNFLCIKDHSILVIDGASAAKKVLRNLSEKARYDPKRYGAIFLHAKKEYQRLASIGQIFPNKKEIRENGIDYIALDLSNITGGYGGAHCMTAVIERG
jgi:arginine deiminase